MGGEKTKKIYGKDGKKGSPPRGRGKVSDILSKALTGRITPAWAGKSHWLIEIYVCVQDHPRVGGEKTKKIP